MQASQWQVVLANNPRANLTFRKLEAKDMRTLGEHLRIDTTVTALDLRSNVFEAEGAEVLAEAVLAGNSSTLRELNVGWCRIGDRGAAALGKALATNTTLTHLAVQVSQIGKEGTIALCSALASNLCLRVLDLGANMIGDEGALALAGALKNNELGVLESLKLFDCKIGEAGARALGDALQSNGTLTDLNLDENPLGVAGIKSIAAALSFNDTLCRLSLRGTALFDESTLSALARGVEDNCSLTSVEIGAVEPRIKDSLLKNTQNKPRRCLSLLGLLIGVLSS